MLVAVHRLIVQRTASQLEKQEAAAVAAPYQLSAGQSFPTEDEALASSASAAPASTVESLPSPSHPTGTSWPSGAAQANAASSSAPTKWPVVGAAVGVGVAVVLLLIGLGLMYRRKHRARPSSQTRTTSQVATCTVPASPSFGDAASPPPVDDKRFELRGDEAAVEMAA